MRTVAVTIEGRDTSLGRTIEVAENGSTRMRGLLGRKSLAAEEGLWIRPSSGVHTIGMAFPIDVVGLDKGMKVVRLWNDLKPQRLTSVTLVVKSVLELPAGSIQAAGLRLGDRVCITRTEVGPQ